MSPNPFIVYGSAVISHCAALCTIDDLKRGRNFKLSVLFTLYIAFYIKKFLERWKNAFIKRTAYEIGNTYRVLYWIKNLTLREKEGHI